MKYLIGGYYEEYTTHRQDQHYPWGIYQPYVRIWLNRKISVSIFYMQTKMAVLWSVMKLCWSTQMPVTHIPKNTTYYPYIICSPASTVHAPMHSCSNGPLSSSGYIIYGTKEGFLVKKLRISRWRQQCIKRRSSQHETLCKPPRAGGCMPMKPVLPLSLSHTCQVHPHSSFGTSCSSLLGKEAHVSAQLPP